MSPRLRHPSVRPVETVLKAVAYRRRLLLLVALAHREPRELRALSADLGIPLKTVSRNLRILERAGLVEGTILRGRVSYRLPASAPPLAQVLTAVVVDAVRQGEGIGVASGNGGPVRAEDRRPGWVVASWGRVRRWLTRWMFSW